MKFTTKNIRYEPHDLDDEIIFFEFTVFCSEPEELTFEYFCSLDNILEYIKQKNKGFYKFWEHTRKSSGEHGPAQRTTIELIGDEAVGQLYQYVEEYLMISKDIPSEIERRKAFSQLPLEEQISISKQLESAFEGLSASAEEVKNENQKTRLFLKLAETRMRETALEVFPEIADLEAEQLLRFEHLFNLEITWMHDRIQKLLNEHHS